jgi:para-nitrobenzyl esterase|tara:strand:- start:3991 stop:5616 length:1626 start_codon:yes stop_codon:yes gene_type:complete
VTKADAESNRTGKQRGFLAGLLTAILVSVPVVAVGGARQEQEAPAMTTITTRLGTIVGKLENGIQIYRGVPYAEPPVGERRFKAPELRGPWSGTLDATRPGNRAMQPKIPGLGSSSATYSEDCLVVDIYTPAADGRARPVLFWIHGGAYYIGSGNEHDGSILAAQGDVVIVTVNYRLGVFGFLDLSKYDDALAGSVSNGFRDQILALTWVRDNIKDYGGDPNNVTIFGVSAGGASVNALLAAPSADGLYHRAISQSGLGVTNSPPPLASASILAGYLKVDESELLTLIKQLPAEELLAAQLASGIRVDASVDGVVVTRDTYQAIAERGARGVPYIAGSSRDEATVFTSYAPEGSIFDPMIAVQGTTTWLGAKTFDLLRTGVEPAGYVAALRGAYPFDTSKKLYERVWNEMFRRSAIRTSEAVTAAGSIGWLYRFDLPSSGNGGALGAYHGSDVAFTFNDFARPSIPHRPFLYDPQDPVVLKLAEQWSNTVLAFARTGSPNGAGLPLWSSYSADKREVLILDAVSRIELDPDAKLRKRWGDM